MVWATITDLKCIARGGAIYANGYNVMQISVIFQALDENRKVIQLDDATLRKHVWLIDYNTTHFNQRLENDGWSVRGEPYGYGDYPPSGSVEFISPVTEFVGDDGYNEVDFYISTENNANTIANIGCCVETEPPSENSYSVSSVKLGNQTNFTDPAKFKLLEKVVYSMDNCTERFDDSWVDQGGWVHILEINQEKVPDAYIVAMNLNDYSIVVSCAPNMPGPNSGGWWWRMDVDGDRCAHWWLTFQFTSDPDLTFPFYYNNELLCQLPYSTTGRSIISAYVWHSSDVAYSYGQGQVSPPEFSIVDQFGNSGNFKVVALNEYQDSSRALGFMQYTSA